VPRRRVCRRGAYARPVTALYVASTTTARKRRRLRARVEEQAILKDVVELADRYDVAAKTAVRSNVAPDEAILIEAKKSPHTLIVMGVGRRPGESLSFGDTAAAVLEHAPGSVVFVAS
jgi:nucleotide-binding universal stress UspA family protein